MTEPVKNTFNLALTGKSLTLKKLEVLNLSHIFFLNLHNVVLESYNLIIRNGGYQTCVQIVSPQSLKFVIGQ